MIIILKNISLFVAILLFSGCFEYPIYKEKKVEFNHNISCLKVVSIFESDIEIATKYLHNSEECNNKLILEPHTIHKCHNPRVKSLGSDIDGYVSIKLYEDEKLLFRSQTDFKGDDYSPHLERLIADFITLEEVQTIQK